MRISRIAPVGAVGLTLIVAAPALAALTTGFSSGEYSIQGDAAEDLVVVSCVGGNVTPVAGGPITACSDVTSFWVNPQDGADIVNLSGVSTASYPALTSTRVLVDEGGASFADQVVGSQLADVIDADGLDIVQAGAGDDVITGGADVDGGAGNDVLVEVTGADGADGGPGDDRFVQTLASGGSDGGPGHDTFELDLDRLGAGFPGAIVALTPAQFQLTVPGVGAQSVFMTGFEEAYITLLKGGIQRFSALQFPGQVHVRGSFGRDVITGSKLGDVLKGRLGNDTINARDGKLDLVDCGAGTDTAVVDAQDVVTACEKVSYPRPKTSKIKGPKKIQKGSSASYKFRSSIPGSAFQCKIDKGKWKTCSSPRKVATKKLKPGKHKLIVRAGFPKGNWDLTPSKKKFTVTR